MVLHYSLLHTTHHDEYHYSRNNHESNNETLCQDKELWNKRERELSPEEEEINAKHICIWQKVFFSFVPF